MMLLYLRFKQRGYFLAEMSGSIVVYADEEAVINSSDHDSNNDDVWIANEKEMPGGISGKRLPLARSVELLK